MYLCLQKTRIMAVTVKVKLIVPARCARLIVGPGGQTIRALEGRTSTTVRVVHTVDGVRSEVLIHGETPDAVDAAWREVVVLVGSDWECLPAEERQVIPPLDWDQVMQARAEYGFGRRQEVARAHLSGPDSDSEDDMFLYEDLEEEEEEENNPYLVIERPLFRFRAGREDCLLQEADGGPRATPYDVLETADIGHGMLLAVWRRLAGGGGRYDRLRAQAVRLQLGDAGLIRARDIFARIKRYGLRALAELYRGLFPVGLDVDIVVRILGYAGYPEEPLLEPLGSHYYRGRGAWGSAWSGLEEDGMRSSLLKLHRLGDRLAGRLHRVVFQTPCDLDKIAGVAQNELSLELLDQVSRLVGVVREWGVVPPELAPLVGPWGAAEEVPEPEAAVEEFPEQEAAAEEDPTAGKGVPVTQAHVERYLPEVRARRMCSLAGCGKAGVARCSRCKAWYCSLECQEDDWPSHLFLCFEVPPLEWLDPESRSPSAVTTNSGDTVHVGGATEATEMESGTGGVRDREERGAGVVEGCRLETMRPRD